MSLTAADVAEIMRLVEQSNFDELTLEMDGIKLSLRRGAHPQRHAGPGTEDVTAATASSVQRDPQSAPKFDATVASGASKSPQPQPLPTPRIDTTAASRNTTGSLPQDPRLAPTTDATAAATAGSRANAAAPPADPSIHEVASPLLGTFYRAPKPGAPPFVEVGSHVQAETVVAIIEVMKLMNTVRAGVPGTVTEIVIADGELAEYGQTLLRVRKAG